MHYENVRHYTIRQQWKQNGGVEKTGEFLKFGALVHEDIVQEHMHLSAPAMDSGKLKQCYPSIKIISDSKISQCQKAYLTFYQFGKGPLWIYCGYCFALNCMRTT